MSRVLLILSLIFSLLAPSFAGLAQAAEPCAMDATQMAHDPAMMADCCDSHAQTAAQSTGSCSADQSCCHAASALNNAPFIVLLAVQNPPPQALLLSVIPRTNADCWRPPRFA